MERLAIRELLAWKNKEYRKPLIVEGARQGSKMSRSPWCKTSGKDLARKGVCSTKL